MNHAVFKSVSCICLLLCLPLVLHAQIVTVTRTVTAPGSSPSLGPNGECPICYNCNQSGCTHFAECVGNLCVCPVGFGGPDCSSATCDSTNISALKRSLKPENGTCECEKGFKGFNCNACTDDSACRAPAGTPAGRQYVCNQRVKVWKAGDMYCDVLEPALKAIYKGNSQILVSRNLTSGTTLGSLWYNGKEQFYCKMSKCQQTLSDGDYIWECLDTTCKCVDGSSFCGGKGVIVDLTEALRQVTRSYKMICKNKDISRCSMKFDDLESLFPDGLELNNCFSGECAAENDEPQDLDVTQAKTLSATEISGIIAGSVLLAIAVLALIVAIVKRSRLRHQDIPKDRAGVNVHFHHLGYRVGAKHILRDLTGEIGAGRVMAVLGPSGAGKSTFLDILAGKTKSGKVDGQILVNGMPITPGKFRSISGYVDQEDLLMDALTVRETLMFSAELRLPESMPLQDKRNIVEDTLDVLGLSHVADSRIGGGGVRGISGGEKRRVSIGMELVTSPSILFLDEPTSGLDSYNAYMIVKTLSDLAKTKGKTIIFTIHQPRSDVFQLFDDVLLLAKGDIVYLGPGADATENMKHRGKPCPVGYNIADHLLDVAIQISEQYEKDRISQSSSVGIAMTDSSDTTGHSLHLRQRHTSNLQLSRQASSTTDCDFSDSHLRKSNELKFTPLVQPSIPIEDAEPSSEFRVSGLTQTSVLMRRAGKIIVRKPSLLAAHLLISIVLGVFVGFLYFKTTNTVGGIQNRLGSIFFLLLLIGFSSLSAIGLFNEERMLFLRERSNGYYGPGAFFLTRILFDIIPLRLVPSLLMGTIAYFLIGYVYTVSNYLKFIVIIFLFSALCALFCLFIACSITNLGTSTLVASIAMLFQMLMAGFLINQPSIPEVFRWIPYLSFVKFSYEALAVNDLASLRIQDTLSGIEVDIPATILLVQFGFDINSYGRNLVICVGLALLMLLIIFLLVVFKLKERR